MSQDPSTTSKNHSRVSSKDIDDLFEVSNDKKKKVLTKPSLDDDDSDDDIPPPPAPPATKNNNTNNHHDREEPKDENDSANKILKKNNASMDDASFDEDELLGALPTTTRARTNTLGGIDVSETAISTATTSTNNNPRTGTNSTNNNTPLQETTSSTTTDKQKQEDAFNAIFNNDNNNSTANANNNTLAASVSYRPPAGAATNNSSNTHQDPNDATVISLTTASSTSVPSQQQPHPRPHKKRFQIAARKEFQASPSMGPSSPTNNSASSPLVSPTSATTQASASPPRPSLMTAPVVQIPLPGLMDIFDAVEKATNADDDNTHLPLQPNVKLVVEPRYELPSALDMPLRLRCDFCLKYDSLCFNCHKKWKDIELPQRRTALLSRFSELPEGARLALFFTSCARGDIEFVKMVLGSFKTATKWMSELVPTHLDIFEVFQSNTNHLHEKKVTTGAGTSGDQVLSDSWDEMFIRPGTDLETLPPPKFLRPGLLKLIGRHTALHVAVAYDQLDVAKLLLEHSTSLIRSDRKLMPFQMLPENPDGDDDDDDKNDEEEKKAEEETSAVVKQEDSTGDEKTEEKKDQEKEKDVEQEKKEEQEEVVEEEVDPVKQRIRDWHNAFHEKQVISELIFANRARNLRQRKMFEEADKVYEKLLKKNPRNENALCGRAKMLFDQARFDDCIKQCRDVLQLDMFGGVQWIDFDSSTVHYLMESALKMIHDKAHAVRGPTLKTCGCVYTDKIHMGLLTKMKQEFFAYNICPFIDVQSSFALVNAFHCFTGGPQRKFKKGQLGRVVIRQLQAYVSSLPPQTLTPQLYSNPEIAAVLNQLRFQLPKEIKEKWHAPFTTRGFTVIAFCDFDKILVKAIVEAFNPAYKKGVFARFRKNTPELIAVVKEFEVRYIEAAPVLGEDGQDLSCSRDAPGIWSLIDSSDWEVDESIQLLPQQK